MNNCPETVHQSSNSRLWKLMKLIVADGKSKCNNDNSNLDSDTYEMNILVDAIMKMLIKLKEKCASLEASCKSSEQNVQYLSKKLEDAEKKNTNYKCEKCKDLQKELIAQQKKVSAYSSKVNSVLKLLNWNTVEEDNLEDNRQRAFALLSQAVSSRCDSSSSSRNCSSSGVSMEEVKNNSEVESDEDLTGTEKENVLAPETVPLTSGEALMPVLIIPETMPSQNYAGTETDLQSTPNRKRQRETSPVFYSSSYPKRRKKLHKLQRTPTSKKSEEMKSKAEGSSPSLLKVINKNSKEVSQIADMDKINWKLKKTRQVDEQTGKKLTQTRLSVATFKVPQDLTSMSEFNGGVRISSTPYVVDDVKSDDYDNDVIGPSPESSYVKSQNSRLDKRIRVKRNEEIGDGGCKYEWIEQPADILEDETLFLPLCSPKSKNNNNKTVVSNKENLRVPASSYVQRIVPSEKSNEMNTSYDRVPKVPSPDYKYRRNTVRKKGERKQLDGWDCDHCKQYYEAAGYDLNESELKQRMNLCSRHRDKFCIRNNTPPGFWDPVIPDTPKSSPTK